MGPPGKYIHYLNMGVSFINPEDSVSFCVGSIVAFAFIMRAVIKVKYRDVETPWFEERPNITATVSTPCNSITSLFVTQSVVFYGFMNQLRVAAGENKPFVLTFFCGIISLGPGVGAKCRLF